VRPPESLANGIVPGAFVLDADTATRFARALPPGIVVVARTDAEAQTIASALRKAGHPDARGATDGLRVWTDAGVTLTEPAWKSPLPPGHAVELLGRAPGWIQDVRWEISEFRYDVVVVEGDALIRVPDLPEEALRSLGPRGAAGLGEVVGGPVRG
jgi:hypothetical protein